MPKYPAQLFETDVNNLRWGFKPGEHAAHLADPAKTENFTVITDEDMEADRYADDRAFDHKSVPQKEIFINAGDKLTAERFRNLAVYLDRKYDEEIRKPHANENILGLLLIAKEYLTAGGRKKQQDMLAGFDKKFRSYVKKLERDNENYRYKPEKNEIIDEDVIRNREFLYRAQNQEIISEVRGIWGQVMANTAGNLVTDNAPAYDPKTIGEPSNTKLGMFGAWNAAERPLFPHDPSPNDIKEGYGASDCFMLSALSQIALKDPQKIKDMMKDNMDGTVTVRFFDDRMNEQTHRTEKVPVYVTVKKTVNQLFGNNVYASASLWVQMMEKAYISFQHQYKGMPNSFYSIDYKYADRFMNAIQNEKNYMGGPRMMGFGDFSSLNKLYTKNSKDYIDLTGTDYLTPEKEMYDFLKNQVNVNNEVIIVGNSGMTSENKSFAKSKGIRIQHAYSICGVFEKDGKKYVQLRDPYAMFSAKYDDNGKLVDNSAMMHGQYCGGVENMGNFNLELRDFLTCYDSFGALSEAANNELTEIQHKSDARRPARNEITALEQEKRTASQEGNQQRVDELNARIDQLKNEMPKSWAEEVEAFTKEHPERVHKPGVKPAKIQPKIQPKDVKKANEEFVDLGSEDDYGFADIEDANNIVNVNNKKPELANITKLLNDPEDRKDLLNKLTYLNDDLEKTWMFFSFKNTNNFVNMRDKLKAVCGNIKRLKAEEAKAPVNWDSLKKDIGELCTLAETYADAKYRSITADQAKGKQPSTRAVHRLMDAISLARIGDGDTQVAKTELGFAEGIGIVKRDLDLAEQTANNDQTLGRIRKAQTVLNSYIEQRPALKNQVQEVLEQERINQIPGPENVKDFSASFTSAKSDLSKGSAPVSLT